MMFQTFMTFVNPWKAKRDTRAVHAAKFVVAFNETERVSYTVKL